ncbi:MAG: signal peptide peptidase SppA [Candidatus Woesearchaeota archaeon]
MNQKKSKKESQKNKTIAIIIISALAIFLILSYSISKIDTSNIRTSSSANALIININGEITSQDQAGFFAAGLSSSAIVNQIENAAKDRSVDAIIFQINSPGGTPVASHEIVRAVKEIEKPTVSVIRDTGASGAYWVASATDHIIADELSLTGSVGVLGASLEFYELLERFNVSYRQLTGGEFKDIGSPLRPMTDIEEMMFKEKIDMMHDFFVRDVARNRKLSNEQIDEVKTGIFFIGLESKRVGLIDELGSLNHAKKYLEEKLEKEVNLVRRQQRQGFLEVFLGLVSNNLVSSLTPINTGGIFLK